MRTIQTKITLLFIVVSVSVTGLIALLLSFEIEKSFFERFVAQLDIETRIAEAIVDRSLDRRDAREETCALLQALSQGSRSRLTMITQNGIVAYDSWVPDSLLHTLDDHSTRPEVAIARSQGQGWDKRHSASVGDDLFYFARALRAQFPQNSSFSQVEFIRVAISSRDVDQAIADIRLKIILSSIVVLVVVVGAGRYIAVRVTNPIVEIGSIIREIQEGNLDRKLPTRSNDEIGQLSALVNEMTEKLKRDLEQVRRLERVRSEFLGNVSHELRTPIFSLKGFLETLRDGAVNDPAVNKTFVEKAYHHASRLDTLLNDLIEISRIESGEMKLSLRYFEGGAFLHTVTQEFLDHANRRNQKLELDIPEPEIMVLGDKERLRLAVGNMVDNALKYSDEHSTVTIALVPSETSASIQIRDNGPGIGQEHLSRIFERFYRIDKNRSRDVGGTGLGLAIVKHIIEAHGAKIDVRSEIGKGTTFSFELKR